MLFEKFKSKMICLFKNLMLSWHREVVVLHNLEMVKNTMQYRNTNNNTKNCTIMEELY
ncbi:unknown [Clostridium sp. CAG:914]|nr:unknown [Clostridium sp. CAG:914]